MIDDSVNIRSIQHYMYCPRRYALLEINNDWAENAFVVMADILHKNVHDGSHSFSDSKKIVRSGTAVYNDQPEYNIFGITDCIEFIKAADGIEILGHEGKFKVRIVEYKPRAPKSDIFNDTEFLLRKSVLKSGAVYLNKEGKRKVLTAWQEKKRSTIIHPYLNEKIPLGLLPFVQSSLLAKYLRGEIIEYPCYIVK